MDELSRRIAEKIMTIRDNHYKTPKRPDDKLIREYMNKNRDKFSLSDFAQWVIDNAYGTKRL